MNTLTTDPNIYVDRTLEQILLLAQERKQVAFIPLSDELFIDLDGEAQLNSRVLDVLFETLEEAERVQAWRKS